MDKTRLEQVEELDAKIEKITYDLSSLESRKKEIEEKKFIQQQEIDKLEEKKKFILAKTDKMNKIEKAIYIAFSLRNDLKQIDLINKKIEEGRKQKDSIQNKIDIQNELYANTIKEKDNCMEERKKLYIEQISTNQKEILTQQNSKTMEIKDLSKIYEMTSKYKNNSLMKDIVKLVEERLNQILERNIEKEEENQMN